MDSDDGAPFGPVYKRVRTTTPPSPQPPPPLQPLAVVTGQGAPPRQTHEACSEANFIGESLGISPGRKERLELKSLIIVADMDRNLICKLADLLLYVKEHPNVVSVKMQVLS